MTLARPTPRPIQTSAKSDTPVAAPLIDSAIAARFTSLPKTTGVLRSRRRSASRPRCQRGRSQANEISPDCGSTRPGVPSTTRRTDVMSVLASPAAWTTAWCTTPTGSSVSLVLSSARPITEPVMSAQAAITESGPTSTPITCALPGVTA